MASRRKILFIIVLLFLFNGCGHKYHMSRETLGEASPWPFYRKDTAATGSITGGGFTGKLDIIWEYRTNDKPAGPLTISNGNLIYPGAMNRIKFIDFQTGKYLGYIKTKSNPQTGVVVKDSLAFYAIAPKRNKLYCKNLFNRRTVWNRTVKDAVYGSIIDNNRLIIGSGDGQLTAYNLYTGDIEWRYDSGGRFTAVPTCADGRIYQPSNDGIIFVVDAEDGTELYRVSTDGPVNNAVSVYDRVYGADVLGNVYCFEPENGEVVWKNTLDGPVWTSPAVGNKLLYVGHSGGELVALDLATGRIKWSFDVVEVIKASAIVAGEYVIVGTMGGKLYSLRADDGTLVAKRELGGGLAFPPVTDGESIYVAARNGRIICFGERNE